MNCEFLIDEAKNHHVVVRTCKQRDLDKHSKPLAFVVRSEIVGVNQWGNKITAPIVVPVDRAPAGDDDLKTEARIAFDALLELLPEGENGDDATATVKEWQGTTCDVMREADEDKPKGEKTYERKFRRGRDELKAKGLVVIRGDRVSVPWTARMCGEGEE